MKYLATRNCKELLVSFRLLMVDFKNKRFLVSMQALKCNCLKDQQSSYLYVVRSNVVYLNK